MDLMIDIESLGTRPGDVILSIGACAFDPDGDGTGEEFYRAIDIESCLQMGMQVEGATLEWWAKGLSRKGYVWPMGERVCLQVALIDLAAFIAQVQPEGIWAHSPQFDLSLLEDAYRRCCSPRPWTYRQSRDTRTLFTLTGYEHRREGTHDALTDAKHQAIAVQIALRMWRARLQESQERCLVLMGSLEMMQRAMGADLTMPVDPSPEI